MERVIDRREYRRNNEKEKVIEEEQIDILQRKIKKILFQSLGVSIIILIISFLKCFDCVDILNKIETALNTQITLSSLQKNGQRIIDKTALYYTQMESSIEKMLNMNFEKTPNWNAFISSGENAIINKFENNNIVEEKSGDEKSSEEILSSGEDIIEYESAVEGINQMSEDAKAIKNSYEFIIPVIGTITSEFGVRNSSNPKVSRYHSGLDIAANTGTQILSVIDGDVIEAATDTYYGKYIRIKKDDIVLTYAHCSKLLVKEGTKVKKGQLIAYVGNTGNSTGSHLHLEIKYKDRLVNPKDVLEL